MNLRSVALPFYLTALVIMFFPAMELLLTVWPWSPSVLSWRFGSVGLLVRAIMTPMVGFALLFGTAVALEHRLTLWAVAAAGFFGGAALLLLMGVFSLDLLEFRGVVQPESSLAFDTSSGVVLMKLFAVSLVLLAFGFSAYRVLRKSNKKKRRRSRPEAATLTAVGAQPSEDEEADAEVRAG